MNSLPFEIEKIIYCYYHSIKYNSVLNDIELIYVLYYESLHNPLIQYPLNLGDAIHSINTKNLYYCDLI
jgi:hypothetical protein